MRRNALLTVLVTVGLAFIACGGDTSPSDGDGAAVREISVMMRDIAYEPTVIELARGESVRLRLENGGALSHDFSIDSMPMQGVEMTGGSSAGGHGGHGGGAAMHMALGAGQRGTLEFEATDVGEYVFYCNEPGHRDAGMHGVLRVN